MRTKTAGFSKEKNGTWTIEGKVKIDGVFKHFKARGYKSLADAKSDYNRVKNDFIARQNRKNKVEIFEDLTREYLKTRDLVYDKATCYNDRLLIQNYFYPTFKTLPICDAFDRNLFSYWCKEILSSTKTSSNKKKKIMTRMKDVLKFAYMHKYIDASTYQDCDICILPIKERGNNKTEKVAWSISEQQAFLDAIPLRSMDKIMFSLFVATACRLGEFLALMPKCFDYDKRRIKIFQQVKYNGNSGYTLTDKLKTNDSYRTIVIDKDLADMLNNYIIASRLRPDDFLFGRENPISRTEFRRRLYKYEDKACVRRAVPHSIRHSSAKLLASVCSNATDIEAAARRLGHSAEVFLKVYANHTEEETEETLLNKMSLLRNDA